MVPGLRLAPSAAIATHAAPMVSGVLPYRLDSTTRTRLPPVLTRMIWRIVCFSMLVGNPVGNGMCRLHIGCGAADQELYQVPLALAVATMPNRPSANTTDEMNGCVFTVLLPKGVGNARLWHS
jgi:hypothetical protein